MALSNEVIGLIVAWVLREIIPTMRKKNGQFSVDHKIDYIFTREKKRETIEEYKEKKES